ncbi:MAG: thpR [Chloroflexi bacterium]|nr:thpR [Chloroflexota bacterium]
MSAERLRLFVAIDLPDTWRHRLTEESARLEAASPEFARWVDASLMHVTLVFLGSQAASALPSITSAVDVAAADSIGFSMSLSGLGAFGTPRSVRVVWAATEDRPTGALAAVQRRVAGSLRDAGIVFDEAPFRPHVTLARARKGTTRLQSEAMHSAVAARAHAIASEPTACTEVVLIRSELRPNGPVYTALHYAPLGSMRQKM